LWIEDARLSEGVAWVSVEREERDAQPFWLSVISGLPGAVGEEAIVGKLIPTPHFAGEAVVRRLLTDLDALVEPLVLVIDDLHQLRSAEALAQVELLLARLPPALQVVLVTHRHPHLGLHRLRLAGELTEVRASDLRFCLQETRELLDASAIGPSASGLEILRERTEGWAAGLRLAAITLAGHPEPERSSPSSPAARARNVAHRRHGVVGRLRYPVPMSPSTQEEPRWRSSRPVLRPVSRTCS
jgi:LuxR family maltose regulon positive regulatory protein